MIALKLTKNLEEVPSMEEYKATDKSLKVDQKQMIFVYLNTLI